MVGHEHASLTDGSRAEGFSRRTNHDRLEVELRESIDIAAKYDIPGIIALSGHRNPEESDSKTLRTCAEGLRRIRPYAEEKGVS
jgi:hydroxypyruvate isomerase